MSAIDQPVLTVTGIRKSEGNFSSEGKILISVIRW